MKMYQKARYKMENQHAQYPLKCTIKAAFSQKER